MGLYLGGLITGRIFASEIWGAYFRGGGKLIFGVGLLSEFYGILMYFSLLSMDGQTLDSQKYPDNDWRNCGSMRLCD